MWYIWSCTNLYKWLFSYQLFSAKEDCFRVSLLSREDNLWGRSPMMSLFSWWFLRRFNFLCHFYVGFANISFCESLSYNPFNCTSVLFTLFFLTWYDLTSYSISFPKSISALAFRLWSICFRCIILRHYLNRA